MPKMIHEPCMVVMECKRNGIRAVELCGGRPWKVWHADEWRCPVCGATVLAGFGREGIEDWEESFPAALKAATLKTEYYREFVET